MAPWRLEPTLDAAASAAAVAAAALCLHCGVHRLQHGSREAPLEHFLPWVSLVAAYAALAAHAVAASQREHTRMPRLSRRQLFAVLSCVITLWLYYVPVNLLLPLGTACVGRCRHFIRPSIGWLGAGLDRWFGPVDLADDQWRDFRSNAPLLAAVGGLHLLLGRLSRRLGAERRAAVVAIASVAFAVAIHGERCRDDAHK